MFENNPQTRTPEAFSLGEHGRIKKLKESQRKEVVCYGGVTGVMGVAGVRWACKPNSVEDGHSSMPSALPRGLRSLPGKYDCKAAVGRAIRLPCLALLRVEFTVPAMLPCQRCALTAPFHPYLLSKTTGGLLSVALVKDCSFRSLTGTLPCGVRTFLSVSCNTKRPPGPPNRVILVLVEALSSGNSSASAGKTLVNKVLDNRRNRRIFLSLCHRKNKPVVIPM